MYTNANNLFLPHDVFPYSAACFPPACHYHSLQQMVNPWCMKFTPSKTEGSLRHLKAPEQVTGIGLQTGEKEQAGVLAISLCYPCSPLIILLGSHYQPSYLNYPVEYCRTLFHACSLLGYSACSHYSFFPTERYSLLSM